MVRPIRADRRRPGCWPGVRERRRAAPAPAPRHGTLPARIVRRLRSPARRIVRSLRRHRRWILWPETTRGWWATLDRELAPADLYHACGGLTVAAALAAARKDRRSGRRSFVIFDAIDNTFEGNSVIGIPRLLRRILLARERRWARSADARTTVNEALAARLAARWGVEPPVVIPNWPEPPAPGVEEGSDRIREALGLPPETRIVLFQGRLSPNLGLDEAAEAVLRVDRACLVLLGFGAGWSAAGREIASRGSPDGTSRCRPCTPTSWPRGRRRRTSRSSRSHRSRATSASRRPTSSGSRSWSARRSSSAPGST